MDDAVRIPIDLGHVNAEAEKGARSTHRVTEREDGTLIIDILVTPSCEPATGGEIVVCAAAEGTQRYFPSSTQAPESSTAMDRIGEALRIKVGPIELGSIEQAEGVRALGARVRF